MSDKVKVLVVDDSIIYRQILVEVIEKIADAEIVGTAGSGQVALTKIKTLKPDLLLLDVVMPELDGVQTLQQIKQDYPKIEAIMISSFDMNEAKQTLRLLDIGALDFITKPKVDNAGQGIAELVRYLQPLIHLLQTKKYARISQQDFSASLSTVTPKREVQFEPLIETEKKTLAVQKFDLIVIGISTGGPKALDCLIPKLSGNLTMPIIIVQHMPPLFTESLAKKLDGESALSVSEAQSGEKLSLGHIYIAPGGKHLILRQQLSGDYYLAVNETPPVNNCRPSVDVLFRSVAATFKGKVLSIVMTGMGRDGTEGVRMLKRNGASCWIQDEASSVVWGMPGSVYKENLADEVIALDKLAAKINQL